MARARWLSPPSPHIRTSRPVSRVLYGGLRRVTIIPLGRPLPDASRNLPGRLAGKPAGTEVPRRPYSVLLPVGFAMPVPSPAPRWALTPPFHPYLLNRSRQAVCFLWHFPWGHPRRALPGTVFPWSPDFPPRQPFGSCRSDRPAYWHGRNVTTGRRGVNPCTGPSGKDGTEWLASCSPSASGHARNTGACWPASASRSARHCT